MKTPKSYQNPEMNPFLKLLRKFIDDLAIEALEAAYFPEEFGRELHGSAGTMTVTRPCGCTIRAEHMPDRQIWILTADYSKCKYTKRGDKRRIFCVGCLVIN
jgi:hypothetical protein